MKTWKNKLCLAVNACAARHDDKAFAWAAAAVNESTDFEALGNVPKRFVSLDNKLLKALTDSLPNTALKVQVEESITDAIEQRGRRLRGVQVLHQIVKKYKFSQASDKHFRHMDLGNHYWYGDTPDKITAWIFDTKRLFRDLELDDDTSLQYCIEWARQTGAQKIKFFLDSFNMMKTEIPPNPKYSMSGFWGLLEVYCDDIQRDQNQRARHKAIEENRKQMKGKTSGGKGKDAPYVTPATTGEGKGKGDGKPKGKAKTQGQGKGNSNPSAAQGGSGGGKPNPKSKPKVAAADAKPAPKPPQNTPTYVPKNKATDTFAVVKKRKGKDGTIPCLKFIILNDCKRPNCTFSHDSTQHEFTETEKNHVKTEFGRLRKNAEIKRQLHEQKKGPGAGSGGQRR